MSFPFRRMRFTKQARPTQASHAPNVKIIKIKDVSGEFSFVKIAGVIKITIKMVDSSARRAISKCFRWATMVIMVERAAIGRNEKMEVNITKRRIPLFGLQDRCFRLSYFSNSGDKIN